MKKIRLGEVVPQFKEEEKDNLMTNPSLLCLPPELLVMVASYLDLSSYLALASSSDALLDLLISQHQWEIRLKKTRQGDAGQDKDNLMSDIWETEKEDMELQDLKQLTEFLRHLKDPEGNLLLALLDLICERFPADPNSVNEYGDENEVVSVSCPRHETHHVTPIGFALLERSEMIKGEGEPLQKLLAYNIQHHLALKEHLELIVSRSLHQKQKLERLNIQIVTRWSDESLETWTKVLEHCNFWNIEGIDLNDKMFEALAKESARGTIGKLYISDKVVVHFKRAQLRQLWEITREKWAIQCQGCGGGSRDIKTTRKDEGFCFVVDAIKKVVTKEHAHYKSNIHILYFPDLAINAC